MELIHRHNRCRGITLFRFGQRLVELWYCPKGEIIEPHSHEHFNSTLIMLGGEIEGTIGFRTGRTGWYDFGRRFFIPAGTCHQAKVVGNFCVFLNYERWWDVKPTSAAIDFVS